MSQRSFVHKDYLKALYPKVADKIEAAVSGEGPGYTSYSDMRRNHVVVVETWRLPSGVGAKDGRHALVIENADLFDESWEQDFFPFAFIRFNELPTGFYGQGIVEQLVTLQARVNKYNRHIDICHDRVSIPRVFVDVGSKALKPQLNNRIGQIIPYRGRPPFVVTPPSVAPEIYQRLDRLVSRSFQIPGVSEMHASSKKPAGFESGKAIQEFNDIHSARFAIQAQNYEGVFVEVAKLVIWASKEVHDGQRGNPAVTFREKNLAKKIKWGDVDLETDRYVMQVEPASILSRTPAGRMEFVNTMMQMGYITDPTEAVRLLNHPDLKVDTDRNTAALEDIDATIEELMDGEFSPPDPLQDLELGLDRVRLAYLQIRREGAPEEILQGFRDWIEMAGVLLQQMAPPPPQPAQEEALVDVGDVQSSELQIA